MTGLFMRVALPPLSYGHVVSLRADPDDDAGSLLCAPDGQVPARAPRDDDGDRVAARVQPIVRPLAAVVAQARHDLAGLRLGTADDDLAAALVADGLTLRRASTTLRHDPSGQQR